MFLRRIVFIDRRSFGTVVRRKTIITTISDGEGGRIGNLGGFQRPDLFPKQYDTGIRHEGGGCRRWRKVDVECKNLSGEVAEVLVGIGLKNIGGCGRKVDATSACEKVFEPQICCGLDTLAHWIL